MSWEGIVKFSSTQMRQCAASSCDYHRHHGHSNCSLPTIEIDREGQCMQFKPKKQPSESGSVVRGSR